MEWKWKGREGIERLKERYMRWILGLERRTPGGGEEKRRDQEGKVKRESRKECVRF